MTTTPETAFFTFEIEWTDEEWERVSFKAARAGLTVENYCRSLMGFPPLPENFPEARSIADLTPAND